MTHETENQTKDLDDAPKAAEQQGLPACRYCGVTTLPDANYKTKDEADEAATLRCDCTEARAYQDKQRQKVDRDKSVAKLHECIDEFGKYCAVRGSELTDEIKNLLLSAGGYVLDRAIDTASVKFGRIKANITTNSKDNLVIGFTYADSTKTEVI